MQSLNNALGLVVAQLTRVATDTPGQTPAQVAQAQARVVADFQTNNPELMKTFPDLNKSFLQIIGGEQSADDFIRVAVAKEEIYREFLRGSQALSKAGNTENPRNLIGNIYGADNPDAELTKVLRFITVPSRRIEGKVMAIGEGRDEEVRKALLSLQGFVPEDAIKGLKDNTIPF